ncbi:MAG: DUF169 domain-containing protein [Acidobacteriia bacterium]|nr:DUF169 domain-containing protein [Terriglobia bacterium]
MERLDGPPVGDPSLAGIARLREKLRLSTPLIAVYDARPSDAFEPLVRAGGTACCFSYYGRWLAGETLVLERDHGGCPGAHRALGLEKQYPPYMAHFLTDGAGAPKGEGLRASPEIAQAILDAAHPPEITADTVLIGPLLLGQWETVKSVTFFVDPDRLAAVMTLAGYWSATDVAYAPFGSGCSFLRRALDGGPDERAVVGATDIAMRRYLPRDILTLTVGPTHFAKMLTVPEDSFLYRSWWNDLLDVRNRGRTS